MTAKLYIFDENGVLAECEIVKSNLRTFYLSESLPAFGRTKVIYKNTTTADITIEGAHVKFIEEKEREVSSLYNKMTIIYNAMDKSFEGLK